MIDERHLLGVTSAPFIFTLAGVTDPDPTYSQTKLNTTLLRLIEKINPF